MNPSKDRVLEFVFGHLSTPGGRAARAAMAREGFYHDLLLEPADPQPGQAVIVSAFTGAHVTVDAATLHYTTNGS